MTAVCFGEAGKKHGFESLFFLMDGFSSEVKKKEKKR